MRNLKELQTVIKNLRAEGKEATEKYIEIKEAQEECEQLLSTKENPHIKSVQDEMKVNEKLQADVDKLKKYSEMSESRHDRGE